MKNFVLTTLSLPTVYDCCVKKKNKDKKVLPFSNFFFVLIFCHRKFALEKPAIIDDKELKSLDKILKTDLDCDWADEKEIDYGAKIHFSDGDESTDDDDNEESNNKQLEREDSHQKSMESSTKSISSSSSIRDHQSQNDNNRQPPAYYPSQQRESSTSNPMYPAPSRGQIDPRSMPPPPSNMPSQEANRYYGRKSDPLYETINRKDNLNEVFLLIHIIF